MNNGYKLLTFYTNELKKNEEIIQEIISSDKDSFSLNEDLVAISVALLKLTNDVYLNADKEVFSVNAKLFNLFTPVHEYSEKLLNKSHLLNTYKLHDFVCVDLKNIQNYLTELLGEK